MTYAHARGVGMISFRIYVLGRTLLPQSCPTLIFANHCMGAAAKRNSMKTVITLLCIFISMKNYSQIGSNPVYVPAAPILVPQQSEPTSSGNSTYLFGWLNVIIGNSEYYKRLDNIAQHDFDNNMITVKKACDYYNKGDYESAIYYGRDIRYTQYYEINNIKHFIITTSYFHVNDVNNSKKWYTISKKKVDPETMRKIDAAINSTGMISKIQADEQGKIDEKKRKSHRRHKSALMTGVILTATGIAAALIGYFVIM
jgi:hypothetical protein